MLFRHEMKRYDCDVLGLAEMRWTSTEEVNGGEIIWNREEQEHQRGVRFYLSKKATKALISYKLVNSRIAAKCKGKPVNIMVIQVYAPTTESTKEELEDFYKQVEATLREIG